MAKGGTCVSMIPTWISWDKRPTCVLFGICILSNAPIGYRLQFHVHYGTSPMGHCIPYQVWKWELKFYWRKILSDLFLSWNVWWEH